MVVINNKKYDLRTLKGQSRRKNETCKPNRRTKFTNLKTAQGQLRVRGRRCDPTISEFNRAKKETREAIQKEEEEFRAELDRLAEQKARNPFPDDVTVLKWEDLPLRTKGVLTGRRTIQRELSRKDRGFIICNRTVNQAFVIDIVNRDNMKGIILRHKKKTFGFLFYIDKGNGEKFVELICVKKPPNKFKGFRFGKTLIQEIEKQSDTRKITLTSVRQAINFYKSIGFTVDNISEIRNKDKLEVHMTKRL